MMKKQHKKGVFSRFKITRKNKSKNGLSDLNVAKDSLSSDPNLVSPRHGGDEEQPITTPHKETSRTASYTASETTTSSPSLPSLASSSASRSFFFRSILPPRSFFPRRRFLTTCSIPSLQDESPLEITVQNGDDVAEAHSSSPRALAEIHRTKRAIRNRMGRLDEEAERAFRDAAEAQRGHQSGGREEGTAAPMAAVHLRRFKSLRRESRRCAAQLANLEATELALESARSDGQVIETYGLVKEAFREIRNVNPDVSEEDRVVPTECAGDDDSVCTEWKRWPTNAFVGLTLLNVALTVATTGLAVYVSTNKDEGNSFFCGISFEDASKTCSLPCPKGSPAECPVGRACFLDVTCSTNWVESFVCGRTLEEANSACADPCPSGDSVECPPEMVCFAHTSCVRRLLSAASASPSALHSLTVVGDRPDKQWVQIDGDRSLEGGE